MNFSICTGVKAVHIGIRARIEQRVIHRGGESFALRRRAAFDLHAGQRPLPQRHGLLVMESKFQPRMSCCKFSGRLRHSQRKCAFEQNLFARVRGKFREKSQMIAFQFAAAVQNFCRRDHLAITRAFNVFTFAAPIFRDVCRPDAEFFQRLAELRGKINRVIRVARAIAPAAAGRRTFHPAFNRVIVHDLHKLPRRSAAERWARSIWMRDWSLAET